MNDSPRVLLILPCCNEEKSIGPLLQEIQALRQGYATIVIDDGSRDNTATVARRLSPVVRLSRNLGIGGSIQTGFKYALAENFDFCVQIDGDGQHPPDQIAKLLQTYRKHPTPIVIGSRYLDRCGFQSTLPRRLGSNIIACVLNLLFWQCCVTDPTSGMRLMNRQAIDFFARNYPHDFPEPISLAWALRVGLKISEVPVTMRERAAGESSITGWKPLAYMIRVISHILLARVKPLSFF